MKTVYWGKWKAALLFLGLVAKGMSNADPLPFHWGESAKAIAGIVWPAFDGAFLWLLAPPKPKGDLAASEPQE